MRLLQTPMGLILVFVSGSLYADTKPDLFQMSLEELLNVPITTSTLSHETIRSVPASSTVFSREEIRQLGITRLEDLLNLVAGYQSNQIDGAGHMTVYSSRGRRLGAVGREVLVLLDGHRLNNDFTGGTLLGGVMPALDNVERVEIIRGPGSALYGSNAEMGVINVITRSEREFSLQTGNHGRQDIQAQWQSDAAKTWQVYARQYRSDGENRAIYDPFTHGFTTTADPYQIRELYAQTTLNELTIATRWAEAVSEDFYIGGFVGRPPRFPNRQEDHNSYLDVEWKHSLNESLGFEARLFADQRSHQPQIVSAPLPVYYKATFSERELGARFILRRDEDTQSWLVGSEYRRPDLYKAQAQVFTPFGQAPDVQVNQGGAHEIIGIFAQYQYHFADTTVLTAGAREDHYSDWGRRLSPRLALVHNLNDNQTLKLLYSEAFRAPSPFETKGIGSSVVTSNPNLRPEVSKTTELTWLQSLANGYTAITLFETRIQDAVTEVPAANGARGYANQYLAVSGLELTWHERLTAHWSVNLAYTNMFNPVARVNDEAPQLLSGWLSYSAQPWSAALLLHSASSRRDAIDTDNNFATAEDHTIAGRALVDAHLSWDWRKGITVYMHANNLLNHDYLDPAARYSNVQGVPAHGREVLAGLRWHY